MRFLKPVIAILFITLLWSCKSQLSSAERLERDQTLNNLETQIEQGDYQIIMNAAYPLSTNSLNGVLNEVLIPNGDSASRIDLTDRDDFITINKSNVNADLSYYGERRISSGYGNQDTGIQFNDAPKNYRLQTDYEKGTILIDYVVNDQSESYDVSIEIFSKGNANVSISSSHRSNIRYTGDLEIIERKEG
ncbi:MAG: DUF4251 domain-containing protein [Nonlabens sp.]|uniref:DUF4251 domain-containing protein n=1 Tax=Nonlabens sp. TaxID=1888209 RepID=UPI003EF57573